MRRSVRGELAKSRHDCRNRITRNVVPIPRYDRHREQIIRGSDTYTDESLDVFQYFTVSCYSGYDNSAGSFYGVYRDVFERLAAEDLEFMDSDDEDDAVAPAFGDADSDYERVVGPFYAYWTSYCTKKSYAWLCQHNVAEIRDRRILRHVEKETNRLAQKARKERNDEVRALVAFVKKRDRRVLQHRRILEERAEQNRIKQQANRLEQIRKNRAQVEEDMRQQKEAVGVAGGFSSDYQNQLRQLEASYARDSDDESTDEDAEEGENTRVRINGDDDAGEELDDEEEVYIDELYCVACNKSFTNESSMENHRASKKHNDNIEKLRLEMLDENEAFCAQNANLSLDEPAADESDDAAAAVDSDDAAALSDVEPVEPAAVPKPSAKSKAKKNQRKIQKALSTPPTSDDEPDPAAAAVANDSGSNDELQPKRLTKKMKRKQKKTTATVENGDGGAPSKPAASKKKPIDSDDGDSDVTGGGQNQNWASQRRGMSRRTNGKAERKTKKGDLGAVDIDDVDVDHTCVTCAATFESKNKLFAHLKLANHGVYIDGKGAKAAATNRETTKDTESASIPQSRTKGRRK